MCCYLLVQLMSRIYMFLYSVLSLYIQFNSKVQQLVFSDKTVPLGLYKIVYVRLCDSCASNYMSLSLSLCCITLTDLAEKPFD
jgi:hypothetical protein